MNLIPEQLRYAHTVNPRIASWSNYLRAVIEEEDIRAWAKREEPRTLLEISEEVKRKSLKRRLLALIP